MHISSSSQVRQKGAVLVIALLMLLVMTVLGLTAMQMTRFEERMAGNSRDINVAFQGAEAGLRDAEERLRVMTTRPHACLSPPCVVWQSETLATNKRDLNLAWWTTNAREYGTAGAHEVTDAARDPMVVIEEIFEKDDTLTQGHGPSMSTRIFYRITANSAGAAADTEAVLESTYTRPF